MNDYITEVFGEGGLLSARFPGYEMREGQVTLARMVDEAMRSGRHCLGEGPCGCHVAGQEILLADGATKRVEDIQVGNMLMGPNGEPRNVLALARGEQETVEIQPVKGQPWRVNLDHILTLVRIDNDRIVDVRVRDWFGWSKAQKALHKLIRSAVQFPAGTSPLPLDPYFLGVLLGDGHLSTGTTVAITKPDPEIVALAYEQARVHGLRVRTAGICHYLVGAVGNKRHPVMAALRGLDLFPVRCADKFVPFIYKTSSRAARLSLLAGLLDTDGTLTGRACYDFISKSERLANDVMFIARSVGFAAYVRPCHKTSQWGHSGVYYRLCISGETNRIPCRIARKKAPARQQNKDVLRTGFHVMPTGRVEPYFGFSLDGDGRYILGDFTITHNTGKGVAYGVPAVYHAHHHGKRVVIVTAGINLQEQLVRKDLPLLAEVLPWEFSFALLKGRNNFLCVDRLRESEARGELVNLYSDEQDRQVQAVLDWAGKTVTGDVSELPFVPLPQVWSRVSVTSEECKSDGCHFQSECFAEAARKTARKADIVVTNYHLVFAHLAVRRETGQDLVLPPFDLLVLDEAHEAADIARDFFGFSVSEFSIGRLARYAADFGRKDLAERLRRAAERFFRNVAAFARTPSYRCRLKKPGFADHSGILKELKELASVAGKLEGDEERSQEQQAVARNACRLARTAASRISESVQQEDPGKVYWIELDTKGRARLKAKPIDVSDLLREELFGRTESVTLVSATLATAGSFDFVRRELGVPEDAMEIVAETPFDFERQALLVLPKGLPDPREPSFVDAVSDVFRRVMELCDGRTLGLFTSYRNLNAVYDRVSGNGYRVLRQGDMPRAELAWIFKEDVRSVLLGTDSFWTGVDVPGEALTGLVIDKLPFPCPEDPVVDAICERDRNAFNTYLVPKAVISLRQGVGRLIRSKKDIGVVVILDRRIAEKNYGKKFMRSLPPMLVTRRVENIARFLDEAECARQG